MDKVKAPVTAVPGRRPAEGRAGVAQATARARGDTGMTGDHSLPCRIGEAALSCVGCCLYAFAGKEATLAAIRRNTAEFSRLVPGDEAALLRFRDRQTPGDVVCCNCMEEAPGVLGCPLHPARHAGRDLRRGHCMADFLCRTASLWRREWDEGMRERFAAFVQALRLDACEYSRLMVSDELLEAFLGQARPQMTPPPPACDTRGGVDS